MARRFAIITYDPDVVGRLSPLEISGPFSYAIWRGLCGHTYAKERGIINLTVLIQQPAVPAPEDATTRLHGRRDRDGRRSR